MRARSHIYTHLHLQQLGHFANLSTLQLLKMCAPTRTTKYTLYMAECHVVVCIDGYFNVREQSSAHARVALRIVQICKLTYGMAVP